MNNSFVVSSWDSVFRVLNRPRTRQRRHGWNPGTGKRFWTSANRLDGLRYHFEIIFNGYRIFFREANRSVRETDTSNAESKSEGLGISLS